MIVVIKTLVINFNSVCEMRVSGAVLEFVYTSKETRAISFVTPEEAKEAYNSVITAVRSRQMSVVIPWVKADS